MIWNGIDVSVWGPIQTRRKKHNGMTMQWFSGYDMLSYDPYDLIEPIPLEVRYRDFCDRLSSRLSERS